MDNIEDAVLVPQRAVIEQQGAKFVFVVADDNSVSLRGLEIVERSGDSYVVAGGIEARLSAVPAQTKNSPSSSTAQRLIWMSS